MQDEEKQYKYKVGDTVQLTSGGPVMTITKLNFGGDYFCSWFVGNDMQSKRLAENALKPAEPPKAD